MTTELDDSTSSSDEEDSGSSELEDSMYSEEDDSIVSEELETEQFGRGDPQEPPLGFIFLISPPHKVAKSVGLHA